MGRGNRDQQDYSTLAQINSQKFDRVVEFRAKKASRVVALEIWCSEVP